MITYLKFTKTECKGCMERRKIMSECDFIGLQINRLNYECKERKTRWLKPINGLIKNFTSVYQFCNGYINKMFFFFMRKGVYLTNTWIAGKNLMKIITR